jgi:hypothetical protein
MTTTRQKLWGAKGVFDHILDPELRQKLEATAAEHLAHRANQKKESEVENGPIRFAFSRQTPTRRIGDTVWVRCALDDQRRGGTIREKVGRAYKVEIEDGVFLTVFEPDDCWE